MVLSGGIEVDEFGDYGVAVMILAVVVTVTAKVVMIMARAVLILISALDMAYR